MSSSNSDMEKSTEIVEKDSSDMVFDLDLSLGSNISLTAHDGSASSIEHSTRESIKKLPLTKVHDEAVDGARPKRQELISAERRLCLENEWICERCFNKLLADYKSPVSYFTKTCLQACSVCEQSTYMKNYQNVCYACGRRKNICMVCINGPVVDEMRFFNFDALIIGRNGAIFNTLPGPCQRSIIRSVFKAYDVFEDKSACYDNAVQTFQSLIERNKPKF